MAYRIAVDELGIANDDAVFEGKTPADVLARLAPHLKERHGIDLPDMTKGAGGAFVPFPAHGALPADRGAVVPAAATEGKDDPAVRLIMTRIAEKLNLSDSGLEGDSDLNPYGTAG